MLKRVFVVAFGIAALGASLPAELRQCLPLAAAQPDSCAIRGRVASSPGSSCAKRVSACCPSRQFEGSASRPCRLDRTQPIQAGEPRPSLSRPAAARSLEVVASAAPAPSRVIGRARRRRVRTRRRSLEFASPPDGPRPPPAAPSVPAV